MYQLVEFLKSSKSAYLCACIICPKLKALVICLGFTIILCGVFFIVIFTVNFVTAGCFQPPILLFVYSCGEVFS